MHTRITEVADGIHQLTAVVPDAPVAFNQYLVLGEEPMLFHTGMRGLFQAGSTAAAERLPLDSLRWISFGHVEADECGSMNDWLAVSPEATVAHSQIGCMVSLGDLADRPPRPLDDGECLELGGHVMQWFDTPHVPHGWDAGVMYDQTTRTLFCGDLFTRFGEFPARSDDDIVGPAVRAENEAPGSLSLHPASGSVIRRLAELPVDTLAPMHASAYGGDCQQALRDLADDVERRVEAAAPA
jgi:flavorubredoxin